MLKTKIGAMLLLSLVITGSLVAANTTSRTTLTETKPQTMASPEVASEKAVIKCETEAYRFGLASDDPKTSIIRAAPDKRAAIVKTVVTADEIVFSISGSDGKGWFEISRVDAVSDEEKTLFDGRGWIHSSNLDTSVANSDPKLRAAPNKRSRVVKKLIPDESEARPLSCTGKWMQIRSGKMTGWLSPEGQCANPLTTCS